MSSFHWNTKYKPICSQVRTKIHRVQYLGLHIIYIWRQHSPSHTITFSKTSSIHEITYPLHVPYLKLQWFFQEKVEEIHTKHKILLKILNFFLLKLYIIIQYIMVLTKFLCHYIIEILVNLDYTSKFHNTIKYLILWNSQILKLE